MHTVLQTVCQSMQALGCKHHVCETAPSFAEKIEDGVFGGFISWATQ